MNILIINDDGFKSPFLKILVDYFNTSDNKLTICVPSEEQSWKAKSMTRFGEIKVKNIVLDGMEVTALGGTPADCANIGIYNVCNQKPDLVLSGINIGTNASLCFAMASGTLGACFEANLANIPSIAFSWQVKREDYHKWCDEHKLSDESVIMYKEMFLSKIESIISYINQDEDYKLKKNYTWSVNLPKVVSKDSEIKKTTLAEFSYQYCFKKVGESFTHAVDFKIPESKKGTDIHCLSEGNISITKMNLSNLVV